MKKMVFVVLGCLLTTGAGAMEVYTGKSIEPGAPGKEIPIHRAKGTESYRAKEIRVEGAKPVEPYSGKPAAAVPSSPGSSGGSAATPAPAVQPRIFTKEEREKMHMNDAQAGRTRESMSSGSSKKKQKGAKKSKPVSRTYNPDPYNTGGWNYTTNQPASPIWNPNSQ